MNNRKLKKWINKTLGKNIKKLRLEKEFSQQYVAGIMKISLKKYKKLEKDINHLNSFMFFMQAKFLMYLFT